MPDVAFKDLVFDVSNTPGNVRRIAAMWGAFLGQPFAMQRNGDAQIDPPPGGPKELRIWVNAVPEQLTEKSRVHLDLHASGGDVQPFVERGCSVVRAPDGEIRWHVLETPDHDQFCVMAPHPQAPDALGPFELVVDALDPVAQATWWAERTGGTCTAPADRPFAYIEHAAGFPWRYWVFVRVPEAKTVKNRNHWDVQLVDATVDDLVAAGATLVRQRDHEISWTVLADPEGNEFCAF